MENVEPLNRIEVINLDGQIVRIFKGTVQNRSTYKRDNLPSGMYFLKIRDENSVVEKLLIQ